MAEVADFFGVSLNTVKEWRKFEMPGHQGRWELGAIARWYLDRRSARRAGSSEGPGPPAAQLTDFAKARLDREIARAEKERMQVDQMKGKLIERTEHERDIDTICGAFRAALARLPNEVGPKLGRKTIGQARCVLGRWVASVVDGLFGEPEGK